MLWTMELLTTFVPILSLMPAGGSGRAFLNWRCQASRESPQSVDMLQSFTFFSFLAELLLPPPQDVVMSCVLILEVLLPEYPSHNA